MTDMVNFDELWEGLKAAGEEEKKKILIAEEISNIIKSIVGARIEKGYTQRELAEKCGVKQSAIARMEKLQAIPRLDTLVKIASSLGVMLVAVAEKEIPLKINIKRQTGYQWQNWPQVIKYNSSSCA
jgi:ribosome-binding protein aMBF1 (putative translation factor)